MTQSYVKPCMYCKAEIEMSDKDGKWLPYNKDGSAHECKKSEPTSNESGSQMDRSYVEKIQIKIMETILKHLKEGQCQHSFMFVMKEVGEN